MALDEALMEGVRAGGPPVLRLYRWRPSCLSLGVNQPALGLYDSDALARLGCDVVRRLTGGRAVLHARELTYAAILPDRLLGSPRDAYTRIHRALAAGLRRLGVEAELRGPLERRAPRPSADPCFADPVEGEVVVRGAKLLGSAQARRGRVLLQHGSLLLDDDQARFAELGIAAPATSTLHGALGRVPAWGELTEALRAAWEGELGARCLDTALSAGETAATERLVSRYRSATWTWRA
jgi:lipoyl(octanoyl) transferase